MVYANTNTQTTQVTETLHVGLGYDTGNGFASSQYIYFPSHQSPPGNAPESWENPAATFA